jgi:hypothetical protein
LQKHTIKRGTTGETGCRKSRRWKNLKIEA